MNADALRQQIQSDRAAGFHPVCVVATAGDVNTGAIDPLDAIADVCEHARLWLHVDGSYGALAAQSPHVAGRDGGARSRRFAVARSAQVAVCAARRRLPAGQGRGARCGAPSREGAGYIDVVADRDMSEFAYWDHSPELSRRFRALKIWFLLKIHGARAIQAAIDGNIAVAQAPGALPSTPATTSNAWRRRR